MKLNLARAVSQCCSPGVVDTVAVKTGSSDVLGTRCSDDKTFEQMIKIDGTFLMGTNDSVQVAGDGEGPVRKVSANHFLMDSTAVSNAQFNDFVNESGYKTDAERFGWSYVFHKFVSKEISSEGSISVAAAPWWVRVDEASWRCPEGPDSDLNQRMEHPVVHVSWNDANTYALWMGKRLPTEIEWEFAARGGLVQAKYPWGSQLTPGGKHMCNIWQGQFPYLDTGKDGYIGTAPVRSYQPNGYGFYNMSGNVWEWCSDWFEVPAKRSGFDEGNRGDVLFETKVTKGGSYLCHSSYCNRYRVSARTASTLDSTTGHVGFRCAADVTKTDKESN